MDGKKQKGDRPDPKGNRSAMALTSYVADSKSHYYLQRKIREGNDSVELMERKARVRDPRKRKEHIYQHVCR